MSRWKISRTTSDEIAHRYARLVVYLKRVVIRPGAFCRAELQFGEHLKGNKNFIGPEAKEFVPDVVGSATEARDKDVGIDEKGHLPPGVERFHSGWKRPFRRMERRITDGTEGCHPLRGVGCGRNLTRIVCEAAELLGGPSGQWLVVVRRKGVEPELQPFIKIQDEGAHR